MSVASELRARLERRGHARAATQPRLSSDEQVVVFLRRTGPLDQPISVVNRLREAKVGLRIGHLALNKLASQGWAVCTISCEADTSALAHDLARMNVQLRRRVTADEAVPDIAQERARHELSQREYADLLGVDVRTLQNWEQGRNRPDPAALSLMRLFAKAPEAFEEAVSEPIL